MRLPEWPIDGLWNGGDGVLDLVSSADVCLARAPCVVIDDCGREVGVFLDFCEYVDLLALVATRVDGALLSPYWRRAVEGCVDVPLSPAAA